MAIYRPPKPRWPAVLASITIGLAVGLVVGLVLGGGESDPAEAAREVQAELTAAAGAIDVLTVEYEESVSNGEVVSEAEYRGARDALASSRDRFEEVREALEILAPARVTEIDAAFAALEDSVGSQADPAEVDDQADALIELLQG
ncbi:MAG: hypothetical protein M3280_12875 [Actinomycetota bacterium]|nr:hypothetical protein [Actinomycetota bacterium]